MLMNIESNNALVNQMTIYMTVMLSQFLFSFLKTWVFFSHLDDHSFASLLFDKTKTKTTTTTSQSKSKQKASKLKQCRNNSSKKQSEITRNFCFQQNEQTEHQKNYTVKLVSESVREKKDKEWTPIEQSGYCNPLLFSSLSPLSLYLISRTHQ